MSVVEAPKPYQYKYKALKRNVNTFFCHITVMLKEY